MRDTLVIRQPSHLVFGTQSVFKAHSRGFTLIELMVVIVIAAILLTIAVPSFDSLIKRNNVDSLQSKLSSALSTARTEAASRNKVVTICRSADEATCTAGAWTSGWIIFEDANTAGVAVGDVLIDVYRNSGSYTISSTPAGVNYLSFNSQGFMTGANANNTLFTICEPNNDDTYARGLFVNTSGLVMKTKDSDGDGKHNDPTKSPPDPDVNLACP